ncbi:hypothetical protein GCM10008941_01850 [Rhizomicrobium palustre]
MGLYGWPRGSGKGVQQIVQIRGTDKAASQAYICKTALSFFDAAERRCFAKVATLISSEKNGRDLCL